MKITVKMLNDLGACGNQVHLFIETFGYEANVDQKNILKAIRAGLQVNWFSSDNAEFAPIHKIFNHIMINRMTLKSGDNVRIKSVKALEPFHDMGGGLISEMRKNCGNVVEVKRVWDDCYFSIINDPMDYAYINFYVKEIV